MSAYEKKLREAAEKFKSFPDAINAHLRNAFDRGATDVTITFLEESHEPKAINPFLLIIEDNGRPLTNEQFVTITNPSPRPDGPYETLAITAVHHARMFSVRNESVERTVGFDEYDESQPARQKMMFPRVRVDSGFPPAEGVRISFWFLCTGTGVDPRQESTAARLIKRLPAMLSPREAGMVSVVDEKGTVTRLCVEDAATVDHGDYLVWTPILKAAFDHDKPLVLKYGGVRVPMATVVEIAGKNWHGGTNPFVGLRSPWLDGTVEITRKDGANEFTDALCNFPPEAYHNGLVTLLLDALVATRLAREANENIIQAADKLWKDNDVEFVFHARKHRAYWSSNADFRGQPARIVGFTLTSFGTCYSITLDALHPLFQLNNRSDAIRERVLWAIAEELHADHKLTGPVSGSYLALRDAIDKARG
ncbi:MAG: hypothetical protein WCO25_04410 [Candidatus Uhrbacteria bacterium]